MASNAEGIARASRFTAPELLREPAQAVSNFVVETVESTGVLEIRRAGEKLSYEMGLNTRFGARPDGVVFLGDSVLEDVAEQFAKQAEKDTAVSSVILRGSQLGSTLWNWESEAQRAMRDTEAAVAVVMLDTMDTAFESYREYVKLIDVLKQNGAKQVVLLARPVSTDDRYEAGRGERVTQMKRAARETGVVFADLSSVFMGANGSFPSHVTNQDGVKVQVRERDGYHLTKEGASMMAHEIKLLLGL